MKLYALALLLVLGGVACTQEGAPKEKPAERDSLSYREEPQGALPVNILENHRSDSSSSLKRRNQSGPTPMDQSNDATDVRLTTDIRRALIDNKALSFNAKNVKVITRHGQVTLRGGVRTARERVLVENTAKSRRGVAAVQNELDIINQ